MPTGEQGFSFGTLVRVRVLRSSGVSHALGVQPEEGEIIMMRESYVNRQQNPPLLENMEIVVAVLLMVVCWFSWYVAHERYNLTNRQIAEVACYLALGGLAIAGSAILIATARS